jgi:predicted HTH domain antitoxin
MISKMVMSMMIELPGEFRFSSDFSEQELKLEIALLLFRRRSLSLSRAASWVGLDEAGFQAILTERKIPFQTTKSMSSPAAICDFQQAMNMSDADMELTFGSDYLQKHQWSPTND